MASQSRTDALIYRATAEAWLGKFLLPFLFAALAMVTIANAAGLPPALAGLGLVGLLAGGVYEYLLPMLLNWLKMETTGVTGSINGRRFHFRWSEVLAAWMIQRGRSPYLCLGTSQGTAMISLRFLDIQAVEEGLRGFAPPAALESAAFQRLPQYREWAATRDRLIAEEHPPRIVVDHWLIQVAGWGGLGGLIAAAFQTWQDRNVAALLLVVVLGLLLVWMLTSWGITDFDSEGVRHRTMMGTWRIRWEDLETVEMDPFQLRLVLEGGEKRLALSGPALWMTAGRRDALTLLHAQCEHRQVAIRQSPRALLKASRGTRV